MTPEQSRTLVALRHEYGPYDTLPEFDEGFTAYLHHGARVNPYTDPKDGVKAQAWDRGLECASRWKRMS